MLRPLKVSLIIFLGAFSAHAKPTRLTRAAVAKIIATVPSRPSQARPGVSRADVDAWFKALTKKQQQAVTQHCSNEDNAYDNVCGSTPLVASFDDAPVRLEWNKSFSFTPGFPTTTAWPSAATPWIARDLDGSGCIENGAELFGSNTRLADGSIAKDGFVAIAELDGNRDGLVDAADPGFETLVLWTSSCELTRLSTVIISISLHATPGNRPHEMLRAGMKWRDARGTHDGTVIDVFLPERPLLSEAPASRRGPTTRSPPRQSAD